jgi:8-oxo-dGTP pyrophosphatase MutT (NUDIX family)
VRITGDLLRAALTDPFEPSVAHSIFVRDGAIDAAVIVPIVLEPEPHALLVLRAAHLKDHAGEVAFPGGKPEPADADLWATATREMEEEIGLPPAAIERTGELAPIFVLSGRYRIHPFVGIVREGATPRATSPEIARLLSISILPWLLGELPIHGIRLNVKGIELIATHYELDGCVLYGASAAIFHELLLRLAARLGLPEPAIRLGDDTRSLYRGGG